MELRREFEIVVLRTRTAAQHRKIEPDNAACAPARTDRARFDIEHRIVVVGLGNPLEGLCELALRGLTPWRDVGLDPLHRAASVIDPPVDLHDVEPILQQLDRRQHAVAVQTFGIQPIGRVVRRDDEADIEREQALEQAVKDHRISDVRDMEFIEADQPMAVRDAPRDFVERVRGALQIVQFRMHAAHEFVEVHACLADQRHGRKEGVHQEALAAADVSPQVDAAWHRRPDQQLSQRVGTVCLVGRPVLVQLLQAVDRSLL